MYGMIRIERKRRAYYKCSHAESAYGNDRCQLQPQTYRALDLERAVWDQVVNVVTDTARLKELALGYLRGLQTSDSDPIRRRVVEGRLGDLRRQQAAIVRELADRGTLDALDDALEETQNEIAALQVELDQHERDQTLLSEQATMPDRIEALVAACRTLLIAPDDKLMADIFDLLEVRLDLVEPYRFEGTASIPLPDDIGGDFGKEGLQHP